MSTKKESYKVSFQNIGGEIILSRSINVQAFIFTMNPCFKVLILKRRPERSSYWQPVCGGIENDEELEMAVLREISGETGIKDIRKVMDLKYAFTYKEDKMVN